MVVVGGGGIQTQLPTFYAESKSAKIPNSLYSWWGGVLFDYVRHLVRISGELQNFDKSE